jgi:hypothetical protein
MSNSLVSQVRLSPVFQALMHEAGENDVAEAPRGQKTTEALSADPLRQATLRITAAQETVAELKRFRRALPARRITTAWRLLHIAVETGETPPATRSMMLLRTLREKLHRLRPSYQNPNSPVSHLLDRMLASISEAETRLMPILEQKRRRPGTYEVTEEDLHWLQRCGHCVQCNPVVLKDGRRVYLVDRIRRSEEQIVRHVREGKPLHASY